MENKEYDVDSSVVSIDDIIEIRKFFNTDGTKSVSMEPIRLTFDKGGVTVSCVGNVFRISCRESEHHKVKCAYEMQLDGAILDAYLTMFEYTYAMRSVGDPDHHLRVFYCKESGQSGFCLDKWK